MSKYYDTLFGYLQKLEATIQEPQGEWEGLYSRYVKSIEKTERFLDSKQINSLISLERTIRDKRIYLVSKRTRKKQEISINPYAIKLWLSSPLAHKIMGEIDSMFKEHSRKSIIEDAENLNRIIYSSVRTVMDRTANQRGTLLHLNPLKYVLGQLSDLETCLKGQ